MGLFDLMKPQQKAQVVCITSMLPAVAKQEIMNGRLPILKTSKFFLKSGETCHFMDRAIYEKQVVKKRYVSNGGSYSMPGIFKGTRISVRKGNVQPVEETYYEQNKGTLYITNKRIIFVSQQNGFDKKIGNIVAVTPFRNCVELQFSKGVYRVFVPDGNVVYAVLQQLN